MRYLIMLAFVVVGCQTTQPPKIKSCNRVLTEQFSYYYDNGYKFAGQGTAYDTVALYTFKKGSNTDGVMLVSELSEVTLAQSEAEYSEPCIHKGIRGLVLRFKGDGS